MVCRLGLDWVGGWDVIETVGVPWGQDAASAGSEIVKVDIQIIVSFKCLQPFRHVLFDLTIQGR